MSENENLFLKHLLRQVCKTVNDNRTSEEHMLALHSIIYRLQFSCQETSLLTIKQLHNLAFLFCFSYRPISTSSSKNRSNKHYDGMLVMSSRKIPHPILNVTLKASYRTPNSIKQKIFSLALTKSSIKTTWSKTVSNKTNPADLHLI